MNITDEQKQILLKYGFTPKHDYNPLDDDKNPHISNMYRAYDNPDSFELHTNKSYYHYTYDSELEILVKVVEDDCRPCNLEIRFHHGDASYFGYNFTDENSLIHAFNEFQKSYSEVLNGDSILQKNQQCFIYFFKTIYGVKIGITKNIKKRVSQYKTHSPLDIEVFCSVLCDIKLALSIEKKLHELLSKFNIQGEWFDLPNEILLTVVFNLSIGRLLKEITEENINKSMDLFLKYNNL